MTIRNAITAGDGDPRHGTYNGYTNHNCHCGPCRRANAEYQLEYMARTPEQREKSRLREQRRYARRAS